uniref:(northern house mosquito) hypothetical protein n=1 Tax=Culex pipiens TaxID=7175 RepID=A0A8D8B3Y7_CULPI
MSPSTETLRCSGRPPCWTFRSGPNVTAGPPSCARKGIDSTWRGSTVTPWSGTTKASASRNATPTSWEWDSRIGPPSTASRASSSTRWPTLPWRRRTTIRRS